MNSNADVWFSFVVLIGVVAGAVILWWAFADLVYAAVDLPFAGALERWKRGWLSRDDHNDDAGAHAST
jgi:hypothetical protein